MNRKYSAFSYKAGNSFVHRMPAFIKIILIPVISISFFNLPIYFSLGLIFFLFVLAFRLKFSIREQFEDLKPVIYFAILLYTANFIGFFISDVLADGKNLWLTLRMSVDFAFTDYSTGLMLVKLFAAIQVSSIVFKTSTSLEIREGIGVIEGAIRKILPVSKKNKFTDMLSLFVCFIPIVFKIWNQSKYAWKARGGKNSVEMYLVLCPVLFSVGMKTAWNSAKAILSRSGKDF